MNSDDHNDGLAPEWDELLRDGLVRAPEDFQARVMHRVQHESTDVHFLSSRAISLTELLQSAAVLIGAIAAG